MPNLATWMRPKDEKWFRPFFASHPDVHVFDARKGEVALDQMDGLLLTGGSDISPEFLRQKVADPSVLSKDMDPDRDRRNLRLCRKRFRVDLILGNLQRASGVQRSTGRHAS
jgi:hypothetical protein